MFLVLNAGGLNPYMLIVLSEFLWCGSLKKKSDRAWVPILELKKNCCNLTCYVLLYILQYLYFISYSILYGIWKLIKLMHGIELMLSQMTSCGSMWYFSPAVNGLHFLLFLNNFFNFRTNLDFEKLWSWYTEFP